MSKLVLDIQGMHCDHCVMRVQKALKAVAGVDQAAVALEPGRARVEFDESMATAEALTAAVAKAGYTATVAPG